MEKLFNEMKTVNKYNLWVTKGLIRWAASLHWIFNTLSVGNEFHWLCPLRELDPRSSKQRHKQGGHRQYRQYHSCKFSQAT